MKKVKIYALILVLALGLIGAAYASGWTDELLVTATAETGEMNVRFTSSGLVAEDGDYDSISASLEDGKKTLVVTLDNLYPKSDYNGQTYGDYIWLELEILNDGTVPAIVDSIELFNRTGVWQELRFFRGTTSGMDLVALKDHMEGPMTAGPALDPGDSHTTKIGIWLDADSDSQNASATFNMRFNFKQDNF